MYVLYGGKILMLRYSKFFIYMALVVGLSKINGEKAVGGGWESGCVGDEMKKVVSKRIIKHSWTNLKNVYPNGSYVNKHKPKETSRITKTLSRYNIRNSHKLSKINDCQ